MIRTSPALVFFAVGIANSGAIARSFTYDDFSDTTGLLLRGGTALVGTSVLRLATATQQNFGMVTHSSPESLSTFSTRIDFRISSRGGISDPSGQPGGDGFYFSFGSAPTVNASVLTGTPLVIQFDTFWNPEVGETAGSNAITVYDTRSGSTVIASVPVSPNFDNGQRWSAWLDHTGGSFEVRVSNNGVRPAAPAAAFAFDLVGALGTSVGHAAVTAYSGDAVGNHDLFAWSYVPSPGAGSLLLLTSASVTGRRRRSV